MRKLRLTLILLLVAPIIAFSAEGKGDNKKPQQAQANLAAGCAPATSIIFMEFNNVRTPVYSSGQLWQDIANGQAGYEVPKGSNSFALFAGSLWLGGQDENGQLKAAAGLFGGGVDFYTGPLDNTGTSEINDSTCGVYDRFFQTSRAEVAQFVAFNIAKSKGTADEDFPGYQIPNSILDWPGNGNAARGEAFRLGPYMNVAGDESYEPELGDYPFYDLVGDVDCRESRGDNRSISSRRPLFGDQNYWWIFNDKGNLHTQTNAPAIGMEIHAQAFAFATNDEINDMTFYNYELINRSTFTLTDTYFASWVDPDLGFSGDDYVGCDVERGLGFCYNGDEEDEDARGANGYGTTPAAIGIDFFEGPYQDNDGLNNNIGIGPGEALNGLGYFDPTDTLNTDLEVDNERFGMRRFVYYNIGTANNGDPSLAVHYYNYMRGIWKNGRRMRHGGDGFASAAVEDVNTDFMFPGDSDPLHWGTTDEFGNTTIPQNTNWTEDNPGVGETRNNPGDRRFLQSAGPFTLLPGNVNDITVGVVFAQAQSGGRLASIEELFNADDKAQALFDNCFQVLNGPDAPAPSVQELDREIIIYLTNLETSNNVNETYMESDPNIVTPDTLLNLPTPIIFDDKYRFEGYQVYQLAGPGISVNDIEDPDKARLVFQCDIKNDVVDLINYTFDKGLQANIPVKKVTAANEGIQRSFSVTEDLFASGGDNRLVNFKTYYYIAIAYGHNQFKEYRQGVAPDPQNPLRPAFDGQTMPYIASRKSGDGTSVSPFTAIPHDPTFEGAGTITRSTYGEEIQITRLQGQGNGGTALQLSQASIDQLFEDKAWESADSTVNELDYVAGQGPFRVSIIDPLNVAEGTFYLKFLEEDSILTDTASWVMWLEGSTDTVSSSKTINFDNEQLLLSPNWGLSISITNGIVPGTRIEGTMNGFISSTVEYEDPTRPWLSGIPDSDFENAFNWILSGTNMNSLVLSGLFDDYNDAVGTANIFYDPNQDFESIQQGSIAPYALTRYSLGDPNTPASVVAAVNAPGHDRIDVQNASLATLNSVLLVITNDKSKWTRVPVVETKDDGLSDSQGNLIHAKNEVKIRLSVDKDGNPVDTTGMNLSSLSDIDIPISLDSISDENDPSFISPIGMGWFPGYAINKETGERLNMAFGEDSRYSFNNGDDMLWNPTSTVVEGADPRFIQQIWGGKHYIYIFRRMDPSETVPIPKNFYMTDYDYGALLKELLGRRGNPNTTRVFRRFGYSSCMWVAIPRLEIGETLLSNDVTVNINVSRPFANKDSKIDEGNSALNAALSNQGKPVYKFNTNGKGTLKQQVAVLSDEIERINVVPNPYYALSEYEQGQLDNTVKFTNLPQNCKITIYNSNGTLIRTYNKASPLTYLDWDLNNQVGIPISSGVYIIHIDVPGVGEKILKWFGVVRPVDLNNF